MQTSSRARATRPRRQSHTSAAIGQRRAACPASGRRSTRGTGRAPPTPARRRRPMCVLVRTPPRGPACPAVSRWRWRRPPTTRARSRTMTTLRTARASATCPDAGAARAPRVLARPACGLRSGICSSPWRAGRSWRVRRRTCEGARTDPSVSSPLRPRRSSPRYAAYADSSSCCVACGPESAKSGMWWTVSAWVALGGSDPSRISALPLFSSLFPVPPAYTIALVSIHTLSLFVRALSLCVLLISTRVPFRYESTALRRPCV
ncbi:hypothetical protein BC628DRAFT_831441 [Trametes gibbosa]|uniref:Uncharacterized protein n=1 Tax=Trametes gibbosa TaxID=160864 RepID=A0A6G6FS48_9APHY|nr:hypothetical protein BC628DRAFT_831441 [Trametes gibbosa]QIE48411.1 hypothetical protein [Trametes gibbosa]